MVAEPGLVVVTPGKGDTREHEYSVDVLGTRNSTQQYSSTTNRPVAGTAAYLNASSTMSSTIAANTISADGETWVVVN